MKCPVWSNGGNCDFRPHIDHQNQIEGEILDVLFCLKKMIDSEDGEKAKPKKILENSCIRSSNLLSL